MQRSSRPQRGLSTADGLAFWRERIDPLARQLWEFLLTFSVYPSPLFSGALRLVLSTLVPAGSIGYLPLSLVRNSWWESLISVIVGSVGDARWRSSCSRWGCVVVEVETVSGAARDRAC